MRRSFVFKFWKGMSLLFLPFLLIVHPPGGSKPSGGPDFGQSVEELSAKSDQYLAALVPQGFSGAVLIAQEGEIILKKGYGLADDEEQRPFTAETPFVIGSISKQFTAAAILQLEMEGKLHTGDLISDYLPDVPPDKTNITIHHLLTHTSGLLQFHAQSDFEPLARDEALALIFDSPLLFEPGEQYAYSDAGYVALSVVVEIVSGERFTTYLTEHLFEAAGLNHTAFYNDARWQSDLIAKGYHNGRDQGSPGEWPGPYWSLLGAGGVVSTVGDLYIWQQALEHGSILSPEMVEKLWTPYAAVNERTSYGYGWQISQTEYGGRLIWHVGAGRAHNAEFRYFPERETVIIIGSNRIDDRYLGIGRLYETFHEVIYANEIGKTLSRNVLNNDFSLQPALALPAGFFISLPEFIAAVLLAVLILVLLFRHWRPGIGKLRQ